MRIIIEELVDDFAEEQVVIRCKSMTPGLLKAIAALKAQSPIIAYKGQDIYKMNPEEIYYFEVVDNKTFLYTQKEIYEIRLRLYELEKDLTGDFLRISKSVILNVTKIQALRPAMNSRFEAQLDNGETVIVSRQYVGALKEKFGL